MDCCFGWLRVALGDAASAVGHSGGRGSDSGEIIQDPDEPPDRQDHVPCEHERSFHVFEESVSRQISSPHIGASSSWRASSSPSIDRVLTWASSGVASPPVTPEIFVPESNTTTFLSGDGTKVSPSGSIKSGSETTSVISLSHQENAVTPNFNRRQRSWTLESMKTSSPLTAAEQPCQRRRMVFIIIVFNNFRVMTV